MFHRGGSDYATDSDGSFDGLDMRNDEVNQRSDLNCTGEEVNSRLILHVANAMAVTNSQFSRHFSLW